ncbi:MAG: dTMP kinase [Deltaproteobacteria bacterium]|nr:dTMP kinase [Deltaproteobacteria bacterium]
MYIAFEGIDGSGKTTLSNHVADELRARGLKVFQTRKASGFASPLATALRELARDVRHLTMSPPVETLLGAAREAELLDAAVRPRLEAGEIVIADRSLCSTLVQAVWGRGLDREAVERLLDFAGRALWPDLIVYCDVDPATSRLRRRIQKIRERRTGDFGRKGLTGLVLRERMREGYLALAKASPDRWTVLDNVALGKDEAAQAAFAVVAARLGIDAPRVEPATKRSHAPVALEDVHDWFYDRVCSLVPESPAMAGYLLLGLEDPRAHELRMDLAEAEPAIVAFGVRDLATPDSMRIRYRLASREPEVVAESLTGLDDEDAWELRRSLLDEAPAQIAASLRRIDSRAANRIREAVAELAPAGVLEGLGGLDTRFAWDLREALGRAEPRALALSLRGLDDDRAWELRSRLWADHAAAVIESTTGLLSPAAWELRRRYVARAPKLVVWTIGGMQTEEAWQIREMASALGKELLDSVRGIPDERAWALREKHRAVWPHTAAGSVGALAATPRGEAFLRRELEAHPGDVMVVRKTVAVLGKRTVREARAAGARA